jgi:uncharacterized protein (DUF1778 family)
MLPRDKNKVIQLRVSEELREKIEYYADNTNETISDFIRKAVEQRISLAIQKSVEAQTKYEAEKINEMSVFERPTLPVTPNNLEAAEVLCNGNYPVTVQELKEKVKEMEKPRMVQSFMKGGK